MRRKTDRAKEREKDRQIEKERQREKIDSPVIREPNLKENMSHT